MQNQAFERMSLNTVFRLKAAMRKALKDTNLSRDQVADEMTEIMKIDGLRLPGNSKSISRTILDKWVCESAQHMIPVSLIPVFCQVVDSCLPVKILIQPLNLNIIDRNQSKILEWAEAELEKRKIIEKARKLSEELGL
jgi:hypothetical protein